MHVELGKLIKHIKKKCLKRVFRWIYGPILKNENYKRRTNREVQLTYQKSGINAYLINKRVEWAGHV